MRPPLLVAVAVYNGVVSSTPRRAKELGERWTKHYGGVCELRYHLVWCPKYRRPVLEGAVADRLEALIREKAAEMGGEVLAISVQPDHVHVFLRVSTPYLSPAEVAAGLKGYTSRVLRREFPHLRSRLPTLWSRSYYVGTVGQVSQETVERYIASQSGRR